MLLIPILFSLAGIAQKKPSVSLYVPIGHQGQVTSFDLSPDLSTWVTGGADNAVIIWDARTFRELKRITLSGAVGHACFTNDSKKLIVSVNPKGVGMSQVMANASFILLDISTGKLIKTFSFTANSEFEISARRDLLLLKDYSATREVKSDETNDFINGLFLQKSVSKLSYSLWDLSGDSLKGNIPGFQRTAGITEYKSEYYIITQQHDYANDDFPSTIKVTRLADMQLGMSKRRVAGDDPYNAMVKETLGAEVEKSFPNKNEKKNSNDRVTEQGKPLINGMDLQEGKLGIDLKQAIEKVLGNNFSGSNGLSKNDSAKAPEFGKGLKQLTVSPLGGFYAAYNSKEKKVMLFRVDQKEPLTQFSPKQQSVWDLYFSPDGRQLFCISNSKNDTRYIESWDLATYQGRAGFPTTLNRMKIGSIQDNLIFAAAHDTVFIFNNRGQELALSSGNNYKPHTYGFAPDSAVVRASYFGMGDFRFSANTIPDFSKEWTDRLFKIKYPDIEEEASPAQVDSLKKVFAASMPGNQKTMAEYNSKRTTFFWDLRTGMVESKPVEITYKPTDTISAKYDMVLSNPKYYSGIGNMAGLVKQASQLNGEEKTYSSMDSGSATEQLIRAADYLTLPVLELKKKSRNTPLLTFIATSGTDWVIFNRDNYFMASKNGAKGLSYVSGNRVFSIDQFDARYNRPDIILAQTGLGDTAIVAAYQRAYLKRLEKLGIDSASINNEDNVPEAEIENRSQIEPEQFRENLRLILQARDTRSRLDRYNIWVNDVPLFGQHGEPLREKNIKEFRSLGVDIKLSQGKNKIEFSVINEHGIESYRQPLIVQYTPVPAKTEKVYFVGIGINRFASQLNPLKWCVSDIRSLCRSLKDKIGKDFEVVDTLFDQQVTLENIRELKKKLKQTDINDKLIIAYSGHGLLSAKYEYYLSGYAVNFSKPEEGGIPYTELENLVDNIPARRKLLLLDACNSGEIDPGNIPGSSGGPGKKGIGDSVETIAKRTGKLGLANSFELMRQLFVDVNKGTGATIIAAAQGYQSALEQNKLEHGVFTYSILEAMEKNKTMKVSDLRKWVGEEVYKLTEGKQEPTTRNEPLEADWTIWGKSVPLATPVTPQVQGNKEIKSPVPVVVKNEEPSPEKKPKKPVGSSNEKDPGSLTELANTFIKQMQQNSGQQVENNKATNKEKEVADPNYRNANMENPSGKKTGPAFLIASYPLATDGKEISNSGAPELTTDGVIFSNKTAYTAGNYAAKSMINAEKLEKLDIYNFSLSLSFRPDSIGYLPIITIGRSCRSLGIYINMNGMLELGGENHRVRQPTSVRCIKGQWYDAILTYSEGMAKLWINGKLEAMKEIKIMEQYKCATDKNLSSADYSNGRAFKGNWKNLKLYNGVVLQ